MATKQRINDLEILLSIKDQATKEIKKTNKNIGNTDKLLKQVKFSALALGTSASVAFLTLANNGEQLATSIQQMGKELGISSEESEAFFRSFKEQNPGVEIDALSDGVLTLQERFSEARVETGELFNFAKDFGLEINESVSGARAQTVEFLKILKQLPDEGDRVTTAIAVMGDEGARQFSPIIRDLGKIDELMVELTKNTRDLYSENQIKDIDAFTDSQIRLNNAFDDLSITTFGLVSGPYADMKNAIADLFDQTNEYLKSDFFSSVIETLDYATGGLVGSVIDIETDGEKLIGTSGVPDSLINDTFGESPDQRSSRLLAEANIEAKARRARAAANEKARIADLKAHSDAVKQAVKEQERIEAIAVEESNQRLIRQLEHEQEIATAMAIREIEGVDDINPFDNSVITQTVERQFNQSGEGLSDSEESSIIAALKEIEEDNTMLALRDDTLEVVDAFAGLEGAIGGFADAFFGKGTKAFKLFQSLQVAAATAAAYSSAAQALADFSNLTTAGKIAASLKVLGIGLGLASKIKGITTSGSSGGGGGSVSTPSNIPQAPQQTIQDEARQVVNITIQGRVPNSQIDADDLEDALDRLSSLPGSAVYRLNETA